MFRKSQLIIASSTQNPNLNLSALAKKDNQHMQVIRPLYKLTEPFQETKNNASHHLYPSTIWLSWILLTKKEEQISQKKNLMMKVYLLRTLRMSPTQSKPSWMIALTILMQQFDKSCTCVPDIQKIEPFWLKNWLSLVLYRKLIKIVHMHILVPWCMYRKFYNRLSLSCTKSQHGEMIVKMIIKFMKMWWKYDENMMKIGSK